MQRRIIPAAQWHELSPEERAIRFALGHRPGIAGAEDPPEGTGTPEDPPESAGTGDTERAASDQRAREEAAREGRKPPTQADLDRAYAKLRGAEEERDALRKWKQEREDAEKDAETREREARERAERERDTANQRVRSAYLEVALTRLPEELRIAPDLLDVATPLLDVQYDAEDRPVDLEDAVRRFLESRPSFRARAEEPQQRRERTGRGNPASGRQRAGSLTADDVRRLAKDNPAEFNRAYEAGEIPAEALAGG